MQVVWVRGRDGDGSHNLFATHTEDIKKFDTITATFRVCTLGETYTYYPSDAPTEWDEKKLLGEESKIYMWCTYHDSHNIDEYALFRSREDLETFCNARDKELIKDIEEPLTKLVQTVQELQGLDEDSEEYGKLVLRKWKTISDLISDPESIKSYKCYKIETNNVLWSGDSILPDEIYGCTELDMS